MRFQLFIVYSPCFQQKGLQMLFLIDSMNIVRDGRHSEKKPSNIG